MADRYDDPLDELVVKLRERADSSFFKYLDANADMRFRMLRMAEELSLMNATQGQRAAQAAASPEPSGQAVGYKEKIKS